MLIMKKDYMAEELLEFNQDILSSEAFDPRKARFYHYTRINNAKLILAKDKINCFFVSNIGSMNDLDEISNHEKEKDKVYAISFCNSKSENLPLWFLYGGINGTGVKIGFSADKMKRFLCDDMHVYKVGNDGKIDESHELKHGVDFEVKFGWIYYADYYGKIKYRGKSYSMVNEKEFEKLATNNFFIKRYSWNYEDEFRIVFIFNESVGSRIALRFDKEKYYKDKGIWVGFGPNYNDDKYEKVKDDFKSETGLLKKQMKRSKLRVNYNLLGINKEIILDEFGNYIDLFKSDEEKKNVWKIIKSIAKEKGLR